MKDMFNFLRQKFPNKYYDVSLHNKISSKGHFSVLRMESFIEHLAIVNNFALTNSDLQLLPNVNILKLYFYKPDK